MTTMCVRKVTSHIRGVYVSVSTSVRLGSEA